MIYEELKRQGRRPEGPTGQRSFLPANVSRITRADSWRGGAAFGAGAAVGGLVGLALLGRNVSVIGCGARDPGVGIAGCLGLVAAGGAVVGALLDSSIPQAVYAGSGGRAAVKISPAIGLDRAGLKLALAF